MQPIGLLFRGLALALDALSKSREESSPIDANPRLTHTLWLPPLSTTYQPD